MGKWLVVNSGNNLTELAVNSTDILPTGRTDEVRPHLIKIKIRYRVIVLGLKPVYISRDKLLIMSSYS